MTMVLNIPLRPMVACLLLVVVASRGSADSPKASMLELRGQTMGTTYMVKVFDAVKFEYDIAIEIDAELRLVNDQMSTYLKNSEISRFNASGSMDWFPVSRQTAEVVIAAKQISAATDGAFDVTIGPLVDLWSFGPGERTRTLPEDAIISQIRDSVGHEKLAVRIDPPGLKKSVPQLQVDLSAIAKGHGVDRVVELLHRLGAEHVFVEIGGEVRATGSKGDQPWKVGIQDPSTAASSNAQTQVAVAHPIVDQSMATSGDYRIYFEVNGKRYSHTLDPRSGRPVDHDLASVTVISDTCMKADAWATAMNVLGPDQGLAVAKSEGLDVFLIRRTNDGQFIRMATGSLSPYAQVNDVTSSSAAGPGDRSAAVDGEATWLERLMPTLLVTFIGFAIVLFAMAIGVIFGRKSISGSCGGLSGKTNPDGSASCSLCGTPSDACKELRSKMEAEASSGDAER